MAWAGAYLILYPYCYWAFRLVVGEYGIALSTALMTTMTFSLSFTGMVIYDAMNMDVFGIQSLNESISKSPFRKKLFASWGMKPIVYLTLISMGPMVATLCIRKEKRITRREYVALSLMSAYFSFHWSIANAKIFIPGVNSAIPLLKTLWETITTRLTFIVT
jgi:hypothetical protein